MGQRWRFWARTRSSALPQQADYPPLQINHLLSGNGGGRAPWQKASASPQQADYLPSNPSSLQCLGWHSASAVSWSEASGLWSARRSILEHQKFVDHQMESSACRRGRPDHPAVKEKAGSREPAGSLASPKQHAALADQGFIAPVALV